MRMLSIILCTVVVIQSTSCSEIVPDICPIQIPFVTIDLQPASVEYIQKWAKITGGIGTLLGGCITSCNLSDHYYRTSVETVGLVLGGSVISGVISALLGSLVASMHTEEKQYAHTINSVIQRNNNVYNIYTEIGLTQQQRDTLSRLLSQNFQIANNRAAVYKYIYPLMQKNYSSYGHENCLIQNILDYLDGLAQALEREASALQEMVLDIPPSNDLLLPPAEEKEIANVAVKLATNHKNITQLNDILSPQLIREWAEKMHTLPELDIEQLRTELANEHNTSLNHNDGNVIWTWIQGYFSN